MRIHQRRAWEFQIVLKGEIALLSPRGPGLLETRHLWLSRPDFAHAWRGVPRRSAEVAVFHFSHLPVELQRRFPENEPFFQMPLSENLCRQMDSLAKKTSRYWHQLLPGRTLCFEHALMDLSFLVFEALKESEDEKLPAVPVRRIHNAIKYYSAHVSRNPQLTEIARHAGVSPAQLRRDFITAWHMSPKKTFDDIRLKMALEYLQEEDQSVEQIAERCGFQSASAFSRAFKTKFGHSPRKILGTDID